MGEGCDGEAGGGEQGAGGWAQAADDGAALPARRRGGRGAALRRADLVQRCSTDGAVRWVLRGRPGLSRRWEAALVDAEAAQRAASRVGLITLPVGLALVAAPDRAGRLLRVGEHPAALRVIGGLDLALVPGLLLDGGRWQWLAARAGLNIGIAAYCLRLVRRERAPGAVVAVAAMLVATADDARAIAVLRRAAAR